MKISNETKVGLLAAVAITLLILGFNFLRAKSIFKTGNFLYVDFSNTNGLMVSNPVVANGFRIGSVYEINNIDASLKKIRVAIKLKAKYNIPTDSYAKINSNPLGTPMVEIHLGNATDYVSNNAVITAKEDGGLLEQLTKGVEPVVGQIKTTFASLDSTLKNINAVLDPNAKNNLQTAIANITAITASLNKSAASLEKMLQAQSGSIATSMDNINSFTKNLEANNNKITNTLQNVETTTANLAKADFAGTVEKLQQAVDKMNTVVAKMNSKEGSLGLLMNDKALYNNLNNTVRSVNILVDDLKTHPKRYVNISVFGKKDKSTPLTAPLTETNKP